MWELYDALIEGIPEELTTDELICGSSKTFIRSGEGAGIGTPRLIESRIPMRSGNLLGAPLRVAAECIKSWNFVEASIGLAAINAYYNSPEAAKKAGVAFVDSLRVEDRLNDPFITSQKEIRGKRVTVVGHFPYLERLFEPICDLSIIEWEPSDGDYPVTAAEFLLPGCDYVFFTCTSLVDKSLPRLLELSQGAAGVTIVGPATPMAPVLFDFGVTNLSGFLVKDRDLLSRIMAGAETKRIYATGQKVSLSSSDAVNAFPA